MVFAIASVLIGGLMLITAIFAKCLNDRDFKRRRSHARAPTATSVVIRELRLGVSLEEVDDGDNKLLLLSFMFHTFIVDSLHETCNKIGDTDANLPITSLSHLNLTVKRWCPWYLNGQVGGWTEVYDGLTFCNSQRSWS
ncbi:hypothetical protein Tco_0294853 [Tanacetum coccineum]